MAELLGLVGVVALPPPVVARLLWPVPEMTAPFLSGSYVLHSPVGQCVTLLPIVRVLFTLIYPF